MKEIIPHVKLGESNMYVSSVGMGTYHLREKLGSNDSIDALGSAYEAGITLFDTSDNYGTEELIGLAVKEGVLPRDKVLIATKTGLATSVNEHLEWSATEKRVDTSPNRIKSQVEKSLRLLGDDVGIIDLYQLHSYDPEVAPQEHAEVMSELVSEKKIRSWGISNYPANAISELLKACEAEGFIKPVSSQPFMSILERDAAAIDTARNRGLTILAHSPLHKGFLTDHMIEKIPQMINHQKDKSDDKSETEILDVLTENISKIDKLRKYAQSQGHNLARLAISWAGSENNTVPICSTTNQGYLEDAIEGSSWQLDEKEMEVISEVQADLHETELANQAINIMRSLKLYYK